LQQDIIAGLLSDFVITISAQAIVIVENISAPLSQLLPGDPHLTTDTNVRDFAVR
jgi:hypothetical protein